MEPTAAGRRDPGSLLACGFAITVAMWATGYLTHLPGLRTPGVVVFGLLVGCLVAGGALTALWSGRGAAGGLVAGMIAGACNLLVLGAFLQDAASESLRRSIWLWIPGSIVLSGGIAAFGSLLVGPRPAPAVNWRAAFVGVAAFATLLLLSVGGVVTGFEAGLAVPDWPNSFGYNMFLFPLSRMTGGIFFEHAHRLFGSLVGLTTLVLAVYLWVFERRAWVKWLAAFALVAVIGQGIMGGLRVTGNLTMSADEAHLAPNLALAMVHGVFGQVFFAMLLTLGLVLSRRWQRAEQDAARLLVETAARPVGGDAAPAPRPELDRSIALAGFGLVVVQLVLGALLRHTGAEWALYLHIFFAIVVLAVVSGVGFRAWAVYEGWPVLPIFGKGLLILILVQFALGFGALVAVLLDTSGTPHPLQVLATTLHQTTGALVLGLTALIAVWLIPCARAVRRGDLEAAPIAANAVR